jgi:Na+/H+ antiporter NhaD/arsenite permease-like protein
VFLVVYVGMLLGEIPGLALDRTGVALLGALALVATERVTPAAAWAAVDVPTLALLFGLMVVSAQLRLGGFYTWVTRRIVSAPLVVEGCARRRLAPVPFLLALACAANVGSAATLIGNPQNMLIGQTLRLSFAGFLKDALVPSVVGLVLVWGIIFLSVRGRWDAETPLREVDASPLDRWQAAKGLVVLALLVAGFLFAPVPREVLALGAAALLLTSRKMASRDLIGLVDWRLLVLFIGLFVVNHAVAAAGLAKQANAALHGAGVDLGDMRWLFPATAVLSNLVSNVPAVMLLLPHASHPLAGPILALSSTLAGNLLIVGSIANIIVVDQAAALGVRIGWREHARVGIPVTLATLAVAAAWLALRAISHS